MDITHAVDSFQKLICLNLPGVSNSDKTPIVNNLMHPLANGFSHISVYSTFAFKERVEILKSVAETVFFLIFYTSFSFASFFKMYCNSL